MERHQIPFWELIWSRDHYYSLLIDNIKHYQLKYHFEIYGYVIMPTHFHWIVETDIQFGTISDIMRDLKKYSAWDLMELVETENRHDLLVRFQRASDGCKNQKRKFWMDRFDDKVIRNEEMLSSTLEYIHFNPVKAGIVNEPEDYLYSSARNYAFEDHSILKIKTEW